MTYHSSVVHDEVRLAHMRAEADERVLAIRARQVSSGEHAAAERARIAAVEERRLAELERLLAADARHDIKRTRNAMEAMNESFQQKEIGMCSTQRQLA
jgi:hypothetical protein